MLQRQAVFLIVWTASGETVLRGSKALPAYLPACLPQEKEARKIKLQGGLFYCVWLLLPRLAGWNTWL